MALLATTSFSTDQVVWNSETLRTAVVTGAGSGIGTAKGAQLKFHLHLANQLEQEAAKGERRIHSHCLCPGSVWTPFWQRIPERDVRANECLAPDEVAWLVAAVLARPSVTAEELAPQAPRSEVIVKRLAPFERWDNVIAILHQSHP